MPRNKPSQSPENDSSGQPGPEQTGPESGAAELGAGPEESGPEESGIEESGNQDSGPEVEDPGSPKFFAAEVLDVKLWFKQQEVLAALTRHRRVAVKSGNGLGKGFCAAVAVLWFIHNHDRAIVLSTAPTFRQVRHLLWRQIRRLYWPAAGRLGGTMFATRWELADDRYALGLSADTADQFQGFHSDNMLIVVDEAEGVSEEIYEAIEAVMTSSSPRLLLIGNPTTLTGSFRRAFHEERALYYVVTISALESPNVATGENLWPGLTSAEWVEERREAWGEDNPIFRARVLGEFPAQGDDTLIPLTDVEAAARFDQESSPESSSQSTSQIVPAGTPGAVPAGLHEDSTRVAEEEASGNPPEETREDTRRDAGEDTGEDTRKDAGKDAGEDTREDPDVVLAVDVARFGSDRSVILRRRGFLVEEIRTLRNMDTMELAGWVMAAIREARPRRVYVDEVGVGAGLVDRLNELGFPVHGVNVSLPARQSGVFLNLRAEGFWRLRELLARGLISIPNDNQLIGELAGLRYSYDGLGRLKIESKDEIRKRGLPSPDKADALMMAFLDVFPTPRLWV